MTTFECDLSYEVWSHTYRLQRDEAYLEHHVDETFQRVARDLASCEKESSLWSAKFYEIMQNFQCLPGGRILANAGTGNREVTYINCWVGGSSGVHQDSPNGIYRALEEAKQTLSAEGGYGFHIGFIRPKGQVYQEGETSLGCVGYAKLWDQMSKQLSYQSVGDDQKAYRKTRKGAMMVTLSIFHPDIEDFIDAKQEPGALTHFNMSVLIPDAFWNAIKNKQEWTLWFPDTTFEKYATEWDGDFQKWHRKGYPIKVYRRYLKAAELYDKMMKATYQRNEPGILFEDRINRFNNLYYCESILASNPCGEQLLPISGGCLLGSLNLVHYLNDSRTDWHYEKLRSHIPLFVRLLDNVNDLTWAPLANQREELANKRRIGLGVMGYASALLLLKTRYGSAPALDLTEKLMHVLVQEAYRASINLAKEKGAFPLFNPELYLGSQYIQNVINQELQELIVLHGIRNSHLISIQPTGNTSVFANNVSSGLEPIFSDSYLRTVLIRSRPSQLALPEVDWVHHKLDHRSSHWQWYLEGDEMLLITHFEGETYKFDRSRGLCRDVLVEDDGIRRLKQLGEWDPDANWAVTSFDLSLKDHVDTMKLFAKFSDSGISKTINVPAQIPFEEFRRLYQEAFDSGTIKGITTYREGTAPHVLKRVDRSAE